MNGPDDGSRDAFAENVRDLHDHLAATAELPIGRETNRWLGEAEAVARDAATSDLDRATVTKRVRQVAHLLEEAGDPDHEAAAEHLESARALCATVLEDESDEE